MSKVRIPPQSLESEKATIGCCLIEKGVMSKLTSWVQPKEFYNKQNEIIWTALTELNKEKLPIDTVTLIDKLNDKKQLEDAGGAYYITGLSNDAPSTENAEHYAKKVHEKYIQRVVIKQSILLAESGYDNHEETEKMLHNMRHQTQELLQMRPSRRRGVDIVIPETIESIKTGNNIIPYGIKQLDLPAGGATRKEISVIGGRPSHGKTTLMLNIVKSLIEQGFKVALFNREMSNIEFMKKLMVLESNTLQYASVRHSKLTSADYLEIERVSELIEKKYNPSQFFMYDEVRTLEQSITEIRRIEPDIFIDDYIQIIDARQKDSRDARRHEIANILYDYKWLAKELNCHGLLLSQLSREIENRIDPRPRMSDYAEAGTIEQVCETCLFIFYGYVWSYKEFSEFSAEIISAKTRYGKVGTYEIGFNGNKCKYFDTEEEAENSKAGF